MKKFAHTFHKLRDLMHTFAQRTYPFVERDETGKKRYLGQAFLVRWNKCEASLGDMPDMRCWRIFIWREVIHLWVGVMFWVLALTVHYFLGEPWSWILPGLLVVYFIIQEFIVDRIRYHQPWLRGVIDLVIWIAPLVLFVVINIL